MAADRERLHRLHRPTTGASFAEKQKEDQDAMSRKVEAKVASDPVYLEYPAQEAGDQVTSGVLSHHPQMSFQWDVIDVT